MYAAFDQAIERFRDDPEAWVAVVAASGERAFSAGVDLKDLDSALADGDTSGFGPLALAAGMVTAKPIVAAVEGHCVGEGVAVALSCDFVVASADAEFMVSEARIGINAVDIPLLLARKFGYATAMALLLDGGPKSAEWCLRAGLVQRVVAEGEALGAARDYAESIAAECAPLAVRAMKETTWAAAFDSPDHGREIGERWRRQIMESEDFAEGRRAFAAKRVPLFRGR
jgi:enoyl-CoA hydratase/carnithine racemase